MSRKAANMIIFGISKHDEIARYQVSRYVNYNEAIWLHIRFPFSRTSSYYFAFVGTSREWWTSIFTASNVVNVLKHLQRKHWPVSLRSAKAIHSHELCFNRRCHVILFWMLRRRIFNDGNKAMRLFGCAFYWCSWSYVYVFTQRMMNASICGCCW